MLRIKFLSALLLFISLACSAQDTYTDSLNTFIKNYVDKHEVVTGDDKKSLSFFPINKSYCIIANFEKVNDGKWFTMETSGNIKKVFRVYGVIHFTIHDTALKLNIYQSQNLMA